jgi:uncharacterized protein YqjF (DUF2071 family)
LPSLNRFVSGAQAWKRTLDCHVLGRTVARPQRHAGGCHAWPESIRDLRSGLAATHPLRRSPGPAQAIGFRHPLCVRDRPFLTAEWLNVAAVTFAADEEQLRPYLPTGATIDTLEGSPRVSLVAFEFRRTRVGGLAIPRHIAFPEINLRFYVRHRDERAVVFVREFVPRRAIATVAQVLYNEPYQRVPMSCGAEPTEDGGVQVWHRFGAGSALTITGSAEAAVPDAGSAAHWLTDHSLGVGRRRDGTTLLYNVAHPTWALREVNDLALDVEFSALYGRQWAWLGDATPSHLSLAVGSPITVSRPIPAERNERPLRGG